MKIWIVILASSILLQATTIVGSEIGGRVESVYFQTTALPPLYVVPQELKAYEGIFRAGLQALPEGALATGALLLGGQSLGLTSHETTNLNTLLIKTYSRIAEDPAFKHLPSALSYCFSAQRQTNGHYFLYHPDRLEANPLVIVFLHGFGGNFQFYVWALKTSFPDAVIIAPSWNVSWYGGSPQYLAQALADAGRRLNIETANQWLMGISAGGRGGFAIYPELSSQFRGYVCLASVPEPSAVYRLRKDSRILMLNGARDPMVPVEYARKQADLLRRRVPSFTYREIQSDHFFILSQRVETFSIVRRFFESGGSASAK
jgi:predicted esterase